MPDKKRPPLTGGKQPTTTPATPDKADVVAKALRELRLFSYRPIIRTGFDMIVTDRDCVQVTPVKIVDQQGQPNLDLERKELLRLEVADGVAVFIRADRVIYPRAAAFRALAEDINRPKSDLLFVKAYLFSASNPVSSRFPDR